MAQRKFAGTANPRWRGGLVLQLELLDPESPGSTITKLPETMGRRRISHQLCNISRNEVGKNCMKDEHAREPSVGHDEIKQEDSQALAQIAPLKAKEGGQSGVEA